MKNNSRSKLPFFDQAKLLEKSPRKKQHEILQKLSPEDKASLMKYLDIDLQKQLLTEFSDEQCRSILENYASDDLLLVLEHLDEREQKSYLILLPEARARVMQKYLSFRDKTAGKFIADNLLTFKNKDTVKNAIQTIRATEKKLDLLAYVYVLADNGELSGVLSIQELLTAHDEDLLSDITVKNIITINIGAEQEEIVQKLSDYNLSALPVIDNDNQFIGVITFDDVMDMMTSEQSEDMQKIGGSAPLEKPYLKTSVWSLFRKRIFWLLILFIAEAYTGTVIAHYEETLTKVVALAFFIPLLVGTGGNTGTQVTTTLVRSLATGEVKFRDMFKVIKKEIAVGIILGIAFAFFAMIRSSFLQVGLQISAVVAITALCIVIWSSIISSILPFVLKKLRFDPAVVSGPSITTFVDGTGLIIYFSVANILLDL